MQTRRGPIITSMLDDDLYNMHVGNFFFHRYPGHDVNYTFTCRDHGVKFTNTHPEFVNQLNHLCDLRLTVDEAHYMSKKSLCSDQYLDMLTKTPILTPDSFKCDINGTGGLNFRYGGNPETRILVEVKALALNSQLYFEDKYKDRYQEVIDSTDEWVDEQIDWLVKNAHPMFDNVEGGGRRRFSKERHEQILTRLWNNLPKDDNGNPKFLKGTSNCYFGMKHNIPIFGSQSHQLYMFMQAMTHPAHSMTKAIDEWLDFYKGEISLMLTDTLGDRKWDRDFTPERMERSKGQRHDSGSAGVWASYRLDAYRRNNIDATKKILMFSDSLNLVKANDLTTKYSDAAIIKTLIGTFWTNTLGKKFPDHKAVSQVAKMTWVDGLPTCKLSADDAKAQCEDANYLVFAKGIALNY